MFSSIFDELKELKHPTRNYRLQESFNVKYFKEIKRLMCLELKAVSNLEPTWAFVMELLCEYT